MTRTIRGMILAESVHADARDEIEIPLAVGVPHIRAVAARQHQRMTRIVLQQIAALELNDGGYFDRHYFDNTGT